MARKIIQNDEVVAIKKWFEQRVTHNGEKYVMDFEQTMAVIDESKNTIVVARAGSGKTRTIVAKVVYLIAKQGIRPQDIMIFVFNANAAEEINTRLAEMRVDGKPLLDEEGIAIANTFHAFARKIVYEVYDETQNCGKILATEKEDFVHEILRGMLRNSDWRKRIEYFMYGDSDELGLLDGDRNGSKDREIKQRIIEECDLRHFTRMMTQFINRAQQKFLAGEKTLRKSIDERIGTQGVEAREEAFVRLGEECFRRYHWLLLDKEMRSKLSDGRFSEYGTDFNLIVSWTSKLIANGNVNARELLSKKKFILIDEYQDFSQLFLSVVLAIRKVNPEIKLFVVGDDWQAINRFAGSDVEYFKGFENYFSENTKRLVISTNYRSCRRIVETARKFMHLAMSEDGDFKAKQKSKGDVIIVNPIDTPYEHALVDYDRRANRRDLVYKKITQMMMRREPKQKTVRYIKTIIGIIEQNRRAANILLLHRNNEMNLEGITLERLAMGLKWGLGELKIMASDTFDEKIQIMTMHKSKGLEAEVAILLEADDGVIPKTHPDTRLYGVFGETDEVALDDQKRLFYVAMTRAKKRLYIIHNRNGGEGFMRFLDLY